MKAFGSRRLSESSMIIERGHLPAEFLNRLSLLRIGLESELLQGLDQRNVEPVEPDDGFTRIVRMVMPCQLRRQDEIAFLHHALLTINRGIGAVPLEDEAEGGGGVPMRPGAFPCLHVLKRKLNGMGGGLPLLKRRI